MTDQDLEPIGVDSRRNFLKKALVAGAGAAVTTVVVADAAAALSHDMKRQRFERTAIPGGGDDGDPIPTTAWSSPGIPGQWDTSTVAEAGGVGATANAGTNATGRRDVIVQITDPGTAGFINADPPFVAAGPNIAYQRRGATLNSDSLAVQSQTSTGKGPFTLVGGAANFPVFGTQNAYVARVWLCWSLNG